MCTKYIAMYFKFNYAIIIESDIWQPYAVSPYFKRLSLFYLFLYSSRHDSSNYEFVEFKKWDEELLHWSVLEWRIEKTQSTAMLQMCQLGFCLAKNFKKMSGTKIICLFIVNQLLVFATTFTYHSCLNCGTFNLTVHCTCFIESYGTGHWPV